MGQVDDVAQCVTMDLKQPGNLLYLVGETRDELGGSHYAMVNGLADGNVPTVDAERAGKIFAAIHRAIASGLVRACHDLSEGGLAVAAAEMAFAGGLGASINVHAMAMSGESAPTVVPLFSESNTRFSCEVEPQLVAAFEQTLDGVVFAKIGQVNADSRLILRDGEVKLIDADIYELKEAWQAPLRF
jgi:phosphoribosylformylglycinamidine synthase